MKKLLLLLIAATFAPSLFGLPWSCVCKKPCKSSVIDWPNKEKATEVCRTICEVHGGLDYVQDELQPSGQQIPSCPLLK